jgi:predicted Fe-Mo cluster-binding NifX family protein
VLTVEDGAIVHREVRDKLGHQHFVAQEHAGPAPVGSAEAQGHGMSAASHDRHTNMAQAISDCQVLLCRGMGRGAYLSMQSLDITPVVTDVAGIDEAVRAFVDGELKDHPELLH